MVRSADRLALAMVTAIALTLPTPAIAGPSKKARYAASKDLLAPPGVAAAGSVVRPVYARNLHTHEVTVLSGPGVDAAGLQRFFRCWFTDEHVTMPSGLAARIVEAAEHFGVRHVHVISGYRHPKYNTMLRKKGRQVALRSQHTKGYAIDFSLVSVATRELYQWLLRRHDGGIGYYPGSGFVHVDLGRKRTWRGR